MCQHLASSVERSKPVTPSAQGCEDCLAVGDEWVHLRLCLTCGHVGCCNDSRNKHASVHSREAGHAVVKSFEPDEEWAWCYADEELVERVPTFDGESPPRHLGPPDRTRPSGPRRVRRPARGRRR